MPASTLVKEDPIAGEAVCPWVPPPMPPDRWEPVARVVPRRTAGPVVAMVAGLLVTALAAALVGTGRPAATATPSTPPATVAAGVDPMAITLAARDVSVVTQVYEPGQESGWHSHAGIHAVAVISGVLTVYDSECRPQTFEPGRPYVGGQQPHLVRNETGAPVVMTVTYLNPSAPTTSTRHQPPPDGCPVG